MDALLIFGESRDVMLMDMTEILTVFLLFFLPFQVDNVVRIVGVPLGQVRGIGDLQGVEIAMADARL